MKLLSGSIGILVGIIGTASVTEKSPGSYHAVSDSLIIEVQSHFDSLGLLEIYSGRVSTPVCEGSKCYTIEINFIALCLQQGRACEGEPQLVHRWDNRGHQSRT